MKCELCGSPVRVVGKTTQHYEPVMSEEVKALVEAAGVFASLAPGDSRDYFSGSGYGEVIEVRIFKRHLVRLREALKPFQEENNA